MDQYAGNGCPGISCRRGIVIVTVGIIAGISRIRIEELDDVVDPDVVRLHGHGPAQIQIEVAGGCLLFTLAVQIGNALPVSGQFDVGVIPCDDGLVIRRADGDQTREDLPLMGEE